VTGGNIGLGKQSILAFVKHQPAEIWLAARNVDKAKAAADEVKQQVPDAGTITIVLSHYCILVQSS